MALFITTVSALLLCLHQVTAAGLTSQTQDLARANTEFAFRLIDEINKGTTGNTFISPYSISVALAMTYSGAGGNTHAQMRDEMGFENINGGEVHQYFKELNAFLFDDSKEDILLKIANKLFGQTDYQFFPEFLQQVQDYYDAPLKQLDFAGATEASRNHINEWVESKTEEKIKELIKPGILSPQTVLVLVNAIYFKGLWKIQFDPKNTKKEDFWINPSTAVKVDMMHNTSYFNISSYTTYKALELDYVGNDMAMLVVLPNKGESLSSIEAVFRDGALTTAIESLTQEEVDVKLPRFRITYEMKLKPILSKLGMTDMFSSAANFSRMSKSNLAVSEVVHQAFVEVNEEGTEAAAATAVIIRETAAQEPVEFHVNRPFLIFIREKISQSLLFAGRVIDPPPAGEGTKPPNAGACTFISMLLLLISLFVSLFQ